MNRTFRFYIRNAISSNIRKNSSSGRDARMLQRMIDRGLNKTKSKVPVFKVLKKQNALSAFNNEGTSRRMIAFNKIYMEHIPELVYTSNFGSYFCDFKIQISKVQISKDFNFLDIYYITKNIDAPEYIINNVLSRLATELQIKIRDLKFSGKVPYVRFINDLRLENEIKLQNIFKTIDLGKDVVATQSKTVITSNTTSKPGDSPVMRQDVLGVDVPKIKQRILEDIKRFKAVNIAQSDESAIVSEYPTKLIKFSKKEFFKFYKRRRIEELKRIKKEHHEWYMHENADEDEDEYENEYGANYEVEDEYEDDDDNDDEDDEDEDEDEDEDVNEDEDINEDEADNQSKV